MAECTRPALRWFGGKWNLAPWIIDHMPSHRVYVEPYGGAGSVLMRKPKSYAEIWNDLDGEVVNLFRVLRSNDAEALVSALRLTPFSREEFQQAYDKTDDTVERARRLVIRSFMGFGSNGCNFQKTGFRANSNRSGTTPAHDWVNYPDALELVVNRLSGVTVESRDAGECMRQHDGLETLHYVDPPYMHETRSRPLEHGYAHELTDKDHKSLLDGLMKLEGMVVLSGYPSALYDAALKGWERIERDAVADGARPRKEVLWLNPLCTEALANETMPMFAEAGS